MTESGERPRGSLFRGLFPASTSAADAVPDAATVPRGLRVATAYAWRFVVLAVAIAIVVWLVVQLRLLVIPFLIAILLTALLWPAVAAMLRRGVPRWLAVVLAVVGGLGLVGGSLYLAAWQFAHQWSDVEARSLASFEQLRGFVVGGPLGLTHEQIDTLVADVTRFLSERSSSLWSGALAVGSTVGHIAVGAILTLFILVCLLADGGRVWKWVLALFPHAARDDVHGGATAGWVSVLAYARVQILVAFINAVGIGAGAFLLGVPLALPIAVIVLLGCFIPYVGAILTGSVAVFLALVYNGPWIALWMLVIVLVVHEIEGHILQPLLMGSAVNIHPLAIVLVVAGGAMVAGIPGALFAVPLTAFINVFAHYIARRKAEA